MIFTIGNLITLGLVLVLVLIFRQIDKDNRSIEKIKRFAGRIQDELSVHVEKTSDDLKRHSIELDVQHKAAKIALDRLTAVQTNIANKAEDIELLATRLDEYDAALDRMSSVCTSIEEKVGMIQKKSGFLDSVNKKLDKVQEDIIVLSQAMPALREEFATNAAAVISEFKSEVLDDINTKVQELDAALNQSRTEVLKNLKEATESSKRVREQVEREVSSAEQRLSASQAAHVEESSARIDAKAAEIRALLDEKLNSITRITKEKLGGLRAEISASAEGYLAEAKTAIAQARSDVNSGIGDLDSTLAGLETRISAVTAMLEMTEKASTDMAQSFSQRQDSMAEEINRDLGEMGDRLHSSFETRLGEYSSSIESKFEKLESEIEAIEKLDSLLQSSADKAVATAEAEFRKFANGLLSRQAECEEALIAETRRFKSDIAALDLELDALKASAYQDLEGTLGIFKSDFIKDLGARAAEIEKDYSAWKAGIEESLAEKALAADVDRAALEKDAQADLGRRLAAFNENAQIQYDTLKTRLEHTHSAIAAHSDEIAHTLELLKHAADKNAQRAIEEAGTTIETRIARFHAETSNRIASLRKDFDAQMQVLAQSATSVESELGVARDAATQLADGFRDRLAEAIAHTKSEAEKQLESLAAHMLTQAGSIRAEFTATHQDWMTEAKAERDALQREFAELSARSGAFTADLAKKIAQTMEEFDSAAEALGINLEERAKRAQKSVDQKAATFDDEIVRLRGSLEEAERNSISRLEDDTARLEEKLTDIDRARADFVEQSRVFDQAELLKSKLEANIRALEADLDRIDAQRSQASEVESRLAQARQIEKEIDIKVNNLEAGRQSIRMLETEFGKLAEHARQVEDMFGALDTQRTEIAGLRKELVELAALTGDVDGKYEKLEKKLASIDRVSIEVDKNSRAVKEIQASLEAISTDLAAVPAQIAGMGELVSSLNKQQPAIDKALEKVASLGELVGHTEARIKEVQVAREWIARSETRLEEINRSIQDQLKLFSTIMKEEVSPKERGAPPSEKQEAARKLAQQGWKVDEIAHALKLSRGEVELILEFKGRS